MRKVVIVQARLGSTRLPGKVLLPLGEQTVLAHVVERCRAIESADEVVVATTVKPEDDPIVAEANRLGVKCTRGSEADVLSRYYEAAKAEQADAIVRVTSDCPFLDPQVSDQVIRLFRNGSEAYDYASNTLERSFPRGLDTEVCSFAALERAHQEAVDQPYREHVTAYLHRHPNLFRLGSYAHPADCSRYRWTLDTPEDWELIQAMHRELHSPDRLFTWTEGIQLMEARPDIAALNAHIEQKKFGQ